MRLFKDFAKTLLRRRGYEIYRRPFLPKGVDVFESLRAQWPDRELRMIFDVGANLGQTIARLRPLFPTAEIHAFEPVPATFVLLQRAVAADRRVHPHCLALADRSGEQWIHGHAQSDLNSLNPAVGSAGTNDQATVCIDLQTLAGFCATQQITHIDLLKIDVEGFELPVLEGARSLLTRHAIEFIVVEAGLIPDDPRFTPLSRLAETLQPLGFWLSGVYEQHGWRYRQAAEFCNALFVHETHLA